MDVHINKNLKLFITFYGRLGEHINKNTISTRKMERELNIICTPECFLLLLMCRKKLLKVILTYPKTLKAIFLD